jgi:hypothetical protein
LRTRDQVHVGRARQNGLALGLGDAAGDRDQEGLALGRAFLLQVAQPSQFAEQLLAGLLADMAGVEDDQGAAAGV